jgi:predicted RNA binding protein YcfA (HicA-like mRNA interferase family)
MSKRQTRLDGQRLIRCLQRTGFVVLRVKGSHHFLKHPDGRQTVIPVHRGDILGPGLTNKILRDIKLSHSDLEQLLKS